MSKCWVYHKTNEPIIIDDSELSRYIDDGWADTPAEFITVTDLGIETDDDLAIQQLGDTVTGVVESLNKALNLNEMDKNKLIAYASEHLDIQIEKGFSKSKIIKIINKELEG